MLSDPIVQNSADVITSAGAALNYVHVGGDGKSYRDYKWTQDAGTPLMRTTRNLRVARYPQSDGSFRCVVSRRDEITDLDNDIVYDPMLCSISFVVNTKRPTDGESDVIRLAIRFLAQMLANTSDDGLTERIYNGEY